MDKLKWYHKILLIVALTPLIPLVFALIITAGMTFLFKLPKTIKEYKCSHYYLDFKKKYRPRLLHSPEFRFYNSAVCRNLPIHYIKQESNGLEYFIFDDTIFMFPDFEQINYDVGEWLVFHRGEWSNFGESYNNLLAKLDKEPNLPVRLLVERKMFPSANLNEADVPECVYVTWGYDEAFENEESPLKMRIPQTSKELYEMMLQTPDLCGHFELLPKDGGITWDLQENICIEIGVDPRDCFVGVSRKPFVKWKSHITHWHPTTFEIYKDVCKIGKRGNVLIIRTSMAGASVLYMGNKQDCPYKHGKRNAFGKLYYIEAK